jgi:hypothetical protein
MVSAQTRYLHHQRSFVGLDVIAIQKFQSHRRPDQSQQFTDLHHPAAVAAQ